MCHLRVCLIITRGEHSNELVECYRNGVITTRQEMATAIGIYSYMIINIDYARELREFD